MDTVFTLHIVKDPKVCGGKPCVAGTRIRVWDVHFWHDMEGQAPQEIVASFPQLSLADVHVALAYYLDHRDDIEVEMSQADEFARSMERDQGPTRFTRLRDQLSPLTHHPKPCSPARSR